MLQASYIQIKATIKLTSAFSSFAIVETVVCLKKLLIWLENKFVLESSYLIGQSADGISSSIKRKNLSKTKEKKDLELSEPKPTLQK